MYTETQYKAIMYTLYPQKYFWSWAAKANCINHIVK